MDVRCRLNSSQTNVMNSPTHTRLKHRRSEHTERILVRQNSIGAVGNYAILFNISCSWKPQRANK